MGQTSITQGDITIATSDTNASTLVLSADNSDDAGDYWQFNAADAGMFTLGNDIASAGTFVPQLTLTPNATATSSITAISGQLTAMGNVGIGTASPDYTLDVAGDIGVDQYIYHNGDADTLINFTDDKIVFKAGNLAFTTLEKKGSAPHEITLNDGANNIDFVVKGNGSNAGNPGMKFDASTNRLGINGVGTPSYELDVAGDIGLSEYIYHKGDDDTFIRFQDDDITIKAGNVSFINITEDDSQDKISFNEGRGDLDFIVRSPNESLAVYLNAGNEVFHINHGESNFKTKIHSLNGEVITVNDNGLILNEDGHATNDFRVESDNDTHMLFVDAGNDKLGVAASAPEATVSIGSGKHIITVDQDIRYAHSGDNTVIVEIPGVKIPAYAIISRVVAIVKTASDLSTHLVNVQISTTSGTSADSSISTGTELLGASAGMMSGQISSDSSSPEDIDLVNDPKEVWYTPKLTKNGSSDQYLYVCNAGTGNGTTNSSAGTLTIIVEYYGID